jgi:hypothetical protein
MEREKMGASASSFLLVFHVLLPLFSLPPTPVSHDQAYDSKTIFLEGRRL